MKKVAGSLKVELAQYRDLEAFAQFASDLDEATQKQLARGQRLQEILKQPQYSPLSLDQQVAIIYAGTQGYLDDIPLEKVSSFKQGLLSYLSTAHPKYGEIVLSTKQLTEEAEEILKTAIAEFKQSFVAQAA
jgi:F-type H+-transporting ATPase subunit alpha